MSDVMMKALQLQIESLTRQVEQLSAENERVRNLLTEFDQRHDRDEEEIARLRKKVKEQELSLAAWNAEKRQQCDFFERASEALDGPHK